MQIICVGDLCCDLIVPYGKMQQALFRGDISKEVTRDLQVRMQCGGSVGNVARHLGRLKAQPVFVTPVSRDSLGAYLTEEMEKMGVSNEREVIDADDPANWQSIREMFNK